MKKAQFDSFWYRFCTGGGETAQSGYTKNYSKVCIIYAIDTPPPPLVMEGNVPPNWISCSNFFFAYQAEIVLVNLYINATTSITLCELMHVLKTRKTSKSLSAVEWIQPDTATARLLFFMLMHCRPQHRFHKQGKEMIEQWNLTEFPNYDFTD